MTVSVSGAGKFNVSVSNGSATSSTLFADGSGSVNVTAGQSGTTTVTVIADDVTASDESAVTGSKTCLLYTSLGLNTELTKAIAVGHDLGHAPFGHGGETILTQIAKEHGLEKFWHEKNSLHFVDDIELLEDNDPVSYTHLDVYKRQLVE